jgi:hypothetical protein
MLDLPPEIAAACAPLFDVLPLAQAMDNLVGSQPKQTVLVESLLRQPALADRPALIAGLWLYVDDLDRSHTISQGLEDRTGAYWHGIMHRREGDFSNSHYWMRRAVGHPLLQEQPELDPDGLIDAVAAAQNRTDTASAEGLVDRQRQEWKALFEWCAAQP